MCAKVCNQPQTTNQTGDTHMARTTSHLIEAWNHGDVDYLNKITILSSSEQMSGASQELTWDTPGSPPFTNTASHLQSRLRLSLHTTLNNKANVTPVSEQIWRFDGGHRAPVHQQQSHRNHQRAFNFSFGDYGEPDLRDSVTHFPRLFGCETHILLSWCKNDGASDYSFMTSG